MRTIRIPASVLRFDEGTVGNRLYVVQVDWPELQLTEEQIFTNAAYRAVGWPEPYADRSIIAVEIERG